MTINGKVYCFFEQSGTFKNAFRKLGIPAEDYDIQDNFRQTDIKCDLFEQIKWAWADHPSIFDEITTEDLILAFFPCINFCDAKTMMFRGVSIYQKKWSLDKIMYTNILFSRDRQQYYELLMKLVGVCARKNLRLIIENPWNTSQATYLQNNFLPPTLIDKNRALRGDYYVKPTAYWYFNCEPTTGESFQPNPNPKIVYRQHGAKQKTGVCDEQRSLISPDYARNFICDFIIGKQQQIGQLSLF